MKNKRAFVQTGREAKAVIRLIYIGCLVLAMGCASTNTSLLQTKLEAMSDSELIYHYHMLGMQMDDMDRSREQSLQRRQRIPGNHYPDQDISHIDHLHIADNWSRLKKEKELTLIELEKRGINQP